MLTRTERTHYDASLAYRMAGEKVRHDMTRTQAMQDAAFRDAQALLRGCNVRFNEIPNAHALYSFEAYWMRL